MKVRTIKMGETEKRKEEKKREAWLPFLAEDKPFFGLERRKGHHATSVSSCTPASHSFPLEPRHSNHTMSCYFSQTRMFE